MVSSMFRTGFALLVLALGLAGCGTVSFTSPKTPPASLPTAVMPGVEASQPAVQAAQSFPVRMPGAITNKTLPYQYGRFTVMVQPDGSQRVQGGQFIPEGQPAVNSEAKHLIVIDYTSKELSYFRKEGERYVPVIGYAVIAPPVTFLPRAEVRGKVAGIDLAPIWCPTPTIREAFPDLPPGCLPFGHPQNAMSKAKFLITWQGVSGWSNLVRLHGTPGYPRGNFWDEETFGCIRLEDGAILRLVTMLGANAVKEGIEVVAHKGSLSALLTQ